MRGVYIRKLIVLAACAIVLPAGAAGGREVASSGSPTPRNRPALAIYRPLPSTPLQADGTDLQPVVRARLTVDPRGKVTRVVVLSIEPASRFDRHFLRAAVRGLNEWRFRPALRDGAPVEAEVPVTLRFEPRISGRGAGRYSTLALLLSDSRRESHRRRILALPEEQRTALRKALSDRAEEELAGPGVEATSDRFRLITDAPEKTARALVENLEAAVTAGIGILERHVPIQPARGEIVVYVFSSEASYRSLAGVVDAFEWSSGLYHAAGFLAFHLEWPSSKETAAVLIHEASHAMLDQHILRPGVLLPRWVDEGFAMYMELSEIEGGTAGAGMDRGGPDRPQFVPPSDLGPPDRPGGRESKAGRRGPPFSLAQLIESSNAAFYGARRDQYYLDSWRAVHFLMQGGEDWASERFPLLVLYLAEGYDVERSILRVYGRTISELEGPFRRHARGL